MNKKYDYAIKEMAREGQRCGHFECLENKGLKEKHKYEICVGSLVLDEDPPNIKYDEVLIFLKELRDRINYGLTNWGSEYEEARKRQEKRFRQVDLAIKFLKK